MLSRRWWISTVGGFALLSLIGAWWLVHGAGAAAESPEVAQPIQFNHALHIKNNVKCIVCHPYYETTPRAGLPGVNTCLRCHEDVIQVSPEERKIEAYHQSGREIPWKQVYRMPDHVYFSHRRHVTFGEIACETCHGNVAVLQKPFTRPLITLRMKDCIACHQQQRAKTSLENVEECIRCHR